MTRRVVGPFNRVEGDLEVALDIADGRIAAASVNSPMYRGFEQILEGKVAADALTLVPRICGICSVAQSAAAAAAIADAGGIAVPENGRLAACLTLAVENLADHLSHFYLFFMPDFARADYAGRPWHADAVARFAAVTGGAAREILPARARFMHAMGLLAGKWPHTLAVQPGGSTRPLAASEIYRLRRIVREFRQLLESTVVGDDLAAFGALPDLPALRDWAAARGGQGGGGDLRRFLRIADDAGLWQIGRAVERFLSYGAYDDGAAPLFRRGIVAGGETPQPVLPDRIREDLTHAWYAAGAEPQQPFLGSTVPMAGKAGAYSWCKAPRYDGAVCETGALARQVVDGQPLAVDIVARHGASVAARVVARALEFSRVVPAMERWLDRLDPLAPWCATGALADDCAGVGMVEAARGSLGHWLTVRRGRIHAYQIIAPTTWNFSPRDAAGTPGALEQALQGLPADAQGAIPAAVHHVVRSFDPCMVCTVH